jgi:beta-lactamase class D
MATRIGASAMETYLKKLRYGSQAMGGAVDSFWLDGGLGISADEQVAFLRDFYHERLGVAQRSTTIVKSILVLERTANYTLSGKTGTGEDPDGTMLGWLVGYVERGHDVHFYALNVSAASMDDLPRKWRVDTVRAMLDELGLLRGASES